MKNQLRFLNLSITMIMILAACMPTGTPSPVAVDPELYLNIIWHQHQPFYPVDQETGLVSAPWVRFHAAKDYVDMASMLKDYPQIHVTFNLTPSLIKQIDDLNTGTRDRVWSTTLLPAGDLSDADKTYILMRFFDVNANIIKNFPRYLELQKKRVGTDDAAIQAAIASWSEQDFRDLQLLFNLAWTDPEILAQDPLESIVEQGRDFSEVDKQTVLNVHAELLARVIPIHKELQDTGQIEVTFTPYAHPILPLLIDTNLAQQAVPDISLPEIEFTHGEDAIQQLERGITQYEQHFGKTPSGMWPAEGSVAQMMVGMTSRSGLVWMVTDEGILANSIGLDFTRLEAGVPMNATALYRPYMTGKNDETVNIFFRDTQLSNKVSFDYSQMDAAIAVEDFMGRLHAIRDEVKEQTGGPYVVTVILDGENAWEYYANDGKDFLNGLYTALSADPTFRTVTASEFLSIYEPTPETIPSLWAGSWDNATFETWIGEPEENLAWDYLAITRTTLEEYMTGSKKDSLDKADLDAAYEVMLAAEGSDWFWWYGSDKDSGNDSAFDVGFRESLGQVYDALKVERPLFLLVPIIQPTPVEPDVPIKSVYTPLIDGIISSRSEWQLAGTFHPDAILNTFEFGFDKKTLYLFLDASGKVEPVDIFLEVPSTSTGNAFSDQGQLLGMYSTHRIQINSESGQYSSVILETWDPEISAWKQMDDPNIQAAFTPGIGEIAIPLALLSPTLDSGDSLLFRIATSTTEFPSAAPGRMLLPDMGRTTWLVDIADPENDDTGPGTYTYPTDGVFKPGVFDLLEFKVGQDENNLVFSLRMEGVVENPWNATNGLSVQLIDIYIDTDATSSDNRLLRNGRNAALVSGSGWEYAITIAGWNAGVFTAESSETAEKYIPLTILTDPGKNSIVGRIPLDSIPGDPATWKFAVVVLSNDGYGINGARDVTTSGGQWSLGGAPDDKNHTRILDLLLPEGAPKTQEEYLSNYLPNQGNPTSLAPDSLPQVPLVP